VKLSSQKDQGEIKILLKYSYLPVENHAFVAHLYTCDEWCVWDSVSPSFTPVSKPKDLEAVYVLLNKIYCCCAFSQLVNLCCKNSFWDLLFENRNLEFLQAVLSFLNPCSYIDIVWLYWDFMYFQNRTDKQCTYWVSNKFLSIFDLKLL